MDEWNQVNNNIILPSKWQNWSVDKLIGIGSYGRVYRIHSEDKVAALKVISIPYNDAELEITKKEYPDAEMLNAYYEEQVAQFMSEIHLMERLKGTRNIVDIDASTVVKSSVALKWTIFIRMELLTPLCEYMEEVPFDERKVAELGVSVCRALDICSREHIIHRDIKPENIMVAEGEVFKLGDFGIARDMGRTAGTISIKGSYSYMAPEVFHGIPYDEKIDQYSLGLVLYRLLNRGRSPLVDVQTQIVSSRNREEALARRMAGYELPSPIDATPAMAGIILKACAYEPVERFETIGKMENTLEQFLTGHIVDLNNDLKKHGNVGENIPERMKLCPSCSAIIPQDCRVCPSCSAKQGKYTPTQKKKMKLVGILTGCIIAAAVVMGVPVPSINSVMHLNITDTGFVFPDSSNKLLTEAQVERLSDDELRIAVYEIYARHGYTFGDASTQAYFDSKSWYYATTYTDTDMYMDIDKIFSDVEKSNLEMLTNEEIKRGIN